jgi:hypothetical protein
MNLCNSEILIQIFFVCFQRFVILPPLTGNRKRIAGLNNSRSNNNTIRIHNFRRKDIREKQQTSTMCRMFLGMAQNKKPPAGGG